MNDLMQTCKKDRKDLINQLAPTVGFRNRLTHNYLTLDPEITLKSLKNVPQLYPRFADGIMAFIKTQDK